MPIKAGSALRPAKEKLYEPWIDALDHALLDFI